jgi:hypothetical protein
MTDICELDVGVDAAVFALPPGVDSNGCADAQNTCGCRWICRTGLWPLAGAEGRR